MAADDRGTQDPTIIDRWSGDFPVDELDLPPESQRKSRVGCIDDLHGFAALWQVFKPGEKVPAVEFKRSLVFSRNMDFFNRTQ